MCTTGLALNLRIFFSPRRSGVRYGSYNKQTSSSIRRSPNGLSNGSKTCDNISELIIYTNNIVLKATDNKFSTLQFTTVLNPLNPESNPICYFLALLAHHFLHISRLRVKSLTLRLLMSYIYMEHLFLMSLDHTQRRTTVGRTPLDE